MYSNSSDIAADRISVIVCRIILYHLKLNPSSCLHFTYLLFPASLFSVICTHIHRSIGKLPFETFCIAVVFSSPSIFASHCHFESSIVLNLIYRLHFNLQFLFFFDRKPKLIFDHFQFVLHNPLVLQKYLPVIHQQVCIKNF